MLKRIPRPSAGLVLACLALFASLAGVAGALPGKNTVNGGDVKNNSLTGKDIKESTLKLPPAAVAQGLKVSVYHQNANPISAFGDGGATAVCPAGKQAISGGGLSDSVSVATKLTDSRPSQGPAGSAPGAIVKDGESFTGWRAHWLDDSGQPAGPVTYVVCVG